MTKIVRNTDYGIFDLSLEAMTLYNKLYTCQFKGKPKTVDQICKKRDDPLLIKVVEELGEFANSSWSRLEVVEIPDGVNWWIDTYDGIETIREVHRSW